MTGMGMVQQMLDRRIGEVLPVVEYRKMQEVEDRNAVLQMHNKGYRQSFEIGDEWNGFGDDDADREVNSDTFGIFVAGKLAATIRLSLITPELPDAWALRYCGHILKPKIDKGMVLIEVSRLVVDPALAKQIPELPYIAFRIVAMAHVHFGADECYSVLRPRHVSFYRRLFNAYPEGEPFYYEAFKEDMQMMTLRLNPIRYQTDYQFDSFQSTYLERRQIFGRADAIPGIKAVANTVAA